ncbi:Single myb histone 6 [Euphorbia peplus]|nr:Single myb histone 6 [Euphorbia peplus]
MEDLPGSQKLSTFCNNLRSQNVILTSIESEIKNDSVSEKILDSLEKIELLYRQLKINIPESMIYSYASVALACSFRGLPDNCLDNVFDRRISNLEIINSEFVTDEMRVYRDSIRVLLSNSDKLDKWKDKKMNVKYKEDALMVVKCYVTEAITPIQPALKEAEAELKRLEGKRDGNGSNEKETNPQLEDKGGECKSPEVHGSKRREIQGEMLLLRHTANPRRYRGPPRIADSDDIDSEEMGASELIQALVGDPLIDELIESKEIGTSEANQPLVGDPMIDESMKSKKMGTSEANQALVSSPLTDESIRIRLDNPKSKIISPLKIYEEKKFIKRKLYPTKKIWTPEEEDALREGVEKFGVGKWKSILNSKRDIFVDRHEGDLKDKWRNLMRPASHK